MTPRAKSIFEEVRELAPAEREPRLAAACGADKGLLAEVRSLLADFDASEGFLETPAMAGRASVVLEAVARPFEGRRIGQYRIVRQVGEGGMGVVYEAERDDREISRRVAIKVIKRGLDSEFNQARFRRERQILANLAHPNIAQLLDAGTTEDGLPYFIMEHIEGLPIDEHCRQRDLSIAERVRLLRKVCGAVEHAHGRQVVHRDIKPRNILVTPEGEPKLLDFGISKMLAPDGTPVETTMTLQRVARPEYASPEQMRGAPVTPATDIYSLGVTLYEVLTGKCPYRVASRSPHEIAREVCESPPQRPGKVTGGISPALDRIVLTAMHKDPARRYAAVRDLSADLDRYLAGAPIQARGDSVGYRLGRFVERRKPVAAGIAVAALLGAAWWVKTGAMPERRRALAVVRIENLSQDASLDWMDRGIAELLTTSLAQSDAVEVISTERVRSIIRRLRSDEQLPPSQAGEVARAARADLFVSGALLKVNGRLRLDLRAQDAGSGKVVFAQKLEGADAQAVFSMADQAAAGILTHLTSRAPAASRSVALVTTSNVEALRAYTEGLRLIERFQVPAALQALARAIKLDPHFAMAYFMKAEITAQWNIPAGRALIAKASQAAAAQSLPRMQKLLLQAAQLRLDGRHGDAAAVLESLRREYPREVEPRIELAACRRSEWNVAQSIALEEEVLQLDDKSGYALGWLSYDCAWQGDFARAHDFAERYSRLLDPSDWHGDDMRGDIMGLAERWEQAISQYDKNRAKWPQGVLKPAFAATFLGDYARAESLARSAPELFPAMRFPNVKPISEFVLGNIEVARGNLDAAVAHFEESARLYQQPSFRYDQLFKAAQIHFEQGEPRKVLEMAARHETPWLPGLRGIAHLLLDNRVAAEAEFTALRASLEPLMGEYMAVRTEWLDRLLAEGYAGHHDRVIEQWPRLPRSQWTFYALPVGRAYLAKGMIKEAEPHLDFAFRSRLMYGVPTLYEQQNWMRWLLAEYYLGRAAEQAGRSQEARAHYAAFLLHFERSAARLPQIAQARAALR